MASKSMNFTSEEVMRKIEDSDDDLYEECDDGRDSNYELSDVEPDGSSGDDMLTYVPSVRKDKKGVRLSDATTVMAT